MKKNDYFYLFVFLCLGAAGCFIGDYAGGVLTGSALMLIIFVTVGKVVVSRAARRIDKRIKDMIIDNEI